MTDPPRALLVAWSLCIATLPTLTGCDDIERLVREQPSPAPTQQQHPPPASAVPAPSAAPVVAPTTRNPRSADPLLDHLADQPLRITRHGRCRMGCRHISRAEVEALLRTGRIDPARTRHDGRCPSYAVEGQTDDGQQVRIVYADCPGETRLVTAIDLGRRWDCSCR